MENRNYPFSRLFDELIRLTGRPTTGDLYTDDQQEVFAIALQDAVHDAWERDWWPETLHTAKIEVTTSGDRSTIDYTGTDADGTPYRIGTVLDVLTADPLMTTGTVGCVAYSLQNKLYLHLAGTTGTQYVWVQWRAVPPRFTRTAWDAGTAYAVGDVVYHAATGQCYYCRTASTGDTPTGVSSTHWELQYIPRFLAPYVRAKALAEWLPSQGKWDEADRHHARADQELIDIQDREINQQLPGYQHPRRSTSGSVAGSGSGASTAANVSVSATPSNYTASSQNVESHLSGIDTALASSGGGAVSSVFGRTGAVVAQSGDYTKGDVGLGNADNTADADKPISTATQTALDLKADSTDLATYQLEPSEGAFVDGDKAKLDGIEASATADQSDAEIETAYNNQVGVVSQVDAEAGTSTTPERWTPERVKQAIAALGGGGGSSNWSVPFSPGDFDLDASNVSSGGIGFTPAQLDTGSYKATGLGLQSDSSTLQDGTLQATFATPPWATSLDATTAFQLVFFGDSTTSTQCKMDVTIYGYNSSFGGLTTVDTITGQTVASADTPQVLTLATSDLTSSTLFAFYTISIRLYSKDDDAIYLLAGSINGA